MMRSSSVSMAVVLAVLAATAEAQVPADAMRRPTLLPAVGAPASGVRNAQYAARPAAGYWDYQTAASGGFEGAMTAARPLQEEAELPSPPSEPGRETIIGSPYSAPLDGQDAIIGQPPAAVGSGAAAIAGPGCVDGSCYPSAGLDYGPSLGIVSPSKCWFGGAYGLIFRRIDDDQITLAYDDTDPAVDILRSNDATFCRAGGFETRLGRYLSNCWAIEVVYWGLFPGERTNNIVASNYPGNIVSTFAFTGLEYDAGGGGTAVGDYYVDAGQLRIQREFEYHNVELNLLRNAFPCPMPCQKAHFVWNAGVRYLKIAEGFHFFADDNEMWGDTPANEIAYHIDTENHLVGFQIGGLWDYCLTNRISLRVASKGGIYGNHMTQLQRISGGAGTASINTGPYTGEDYWLETDDNRVSFLGELFAGATFQFGCRWRAVGGYRAVFASGVALPTGQIPRRYFDLAEVGTINSSDSLVLHGVVVGGEYNW